MLFINLLPMSYQTGAEIHGIDKLLSGFKTRTSILPLDIVDELIAFLPAKEAIEGTKTISATLIRLSVVRQHVRLSKIDK